MIVDTATNPAGRHAGATGYSRRLSIRSTRNAMITLLARKPATAYHVDASATAPVNPWSALPNRASPLQVNRMSGGTTHGSAPFPIEVSWYCGP